MTEGPTPIPEPTPAAPPPASQPPPAERTGRARGPLVVAAVVGALLGAAVVGVLWLALGGDDDGDDTAAADATPLAAPTALGGYVPAAGAPALQNENGQRQIERISRLNQRTAQQLSEAFGGAGAVAATYVDDELLTFVPLVAVRAQSPQPWVPYQDPADLHLARAPQEVLRFGDVSCVVQNQANAGGTGAGRGRRHHHELRAHGARTDRAGPVPGAGPRPPAGTGGAARRRGVGQPRRRRVPGRRVAAGGAAPVIRPCDTEADD